MAQPLRSKRSKHSVSGCHAGAAPVPRPGEAGFFYVALLVLMAMSSVALTVVSQVWHTMQVRDREAELLWVGSEMRTAIELYYRSTPAGVVERYPQRLEDLLRDPRYPGTRRYLRRIYRDPVTGRKDWGLLKAGNLITGVYSLSDAEPVKKAGFRVADQAFEGTMKYSQWVFTPRTGNRPVALPADGAGRPGMPVPPPPRPGAAPGRINR